MGTWFEVPVYPNELLSGGLAARRMPKSPHITILHLGSFEGDMRRLHGVQSEAILGWRHDAFAGAECDGSGEFLVGPRSYRVPMLLVDCRALALLRVRLENLLNEAGIVQSDLYGFVPHVTLGNPQVGHYRLERPIPITLDRLDLVVSKKGVEIERRSLPL